VGGVRGKENKVRKTGLKKSGNFIQHDRRSGGRQIMMALPSMDSAVPVSFDPLSGNLISTLQMPNERFVPRLAYKGLAKMALAMMPLEDLSHYRRLTTWVRQPKDDIELNALGVGLSLGSIGNAPPHAMGVLLRRREFTLPVPHFLFLFCAGSVCLQIDLKSDHLEDHLPQFQFCNVANFNWTTMLGAEGKPPEVIIAHGEPRQLDWSSNELASPPVEALRLTFNTRNSNAFFEPVYRN
jgi:hypothetical protein